MLSSHWGIFFHPFISNILCLYSLVVTPLNLISLNFKNLKWWSLSFNEAVVRYTYYDSWCVGLFLPSHIIISICAALPVLFVCLFQVLSSLEFFFLIPCISLNSFGYNVDTFVGYLTKILQRFKHVLGLRASVYVTTVAVNFRAMLPLWITAPILFFSCEDLHTFPPAQTQFKSYFFKYFFQHVAAVEFFMIFSPKYVNLFVFFLKME